MTGSIKLFESLMVDDARFRMLGLIILFWNPKLVFLFRFNQVPVGRLERVKTLNEIAVTNYNAGSKSFR